ncbi:hypothetical protein [Peribacillus simplex]|uniref:hypothetical protein n=1 Tax=Peribacillus simplex TaxID=1478 RepID=UPI00366EBDE4
MMTITLIVVRKNAAMMTITLIVVRKNAAMMTITLIVVRKNAVMMTITLFVVVRRNTALITFGSLLNGKCLDPVIDQGAFLIYYQI